MRSEVSTAVKISVMVFWVVTQHGLVRYIQTFRRKLMLPSSGLDVKEGCFFEIIKYTRKSTWKYKPEDQHRR